MGTQLVEFVRGLPTHVLTQYVNDNLSGTFGMSPSTFALGLTPELSGVGPIEFFDALSEVLRERMVENHNRAEREHREAIKDRIESLPERIG